MLEKEGKKPDFYLYESQPALVKFLDSLSQRASRAIPSSLQKR